MLLLTACTFVFTGVQHSEAAKSAESRGGVYDWGSAFACRYCC